MIVFRLNCYICDKEIAAGNRWDKHLGSKTHLKKTKKILNQSYSFDNRFRYKNFETVAKQFTDLDEVDILCFESQMNNTIEYLNKKHLKI
jgi:hypothetical protein